MLTGASAGGAASAQSGPQPMMTHCHPHVAIHRLQAHYARAKANGNYYVAERAHRHAMNIRRHMRRHHRLPHHGYGY